MEQQEEKKVKSRLNYPWILLGLILVASGIYLYCHKMATEKVVPHYKVAVVDVEAIMAKHRDYDELVKLQGELKEIQQGIATANTNIAELQKLELKPEVFADSLNKEEDLVDFQRENQLDNEAITQRQIIAEALGKNKAVDLEKINQVYGAKIVSVQLKLDNRDLMVLDDEEVNKLKQELNTLETQRRKAVQTVELSYNEQIAQDLAAWKAKRREELGLKADDIKAKLAAGIEQRETVSDQQENDLLTNLQKVMEIKANLIDLKSKEMAKSREVELLKDSIRADIASFATKVALEQHYDLVMVKDLTKTKYPLDGAEVVKSATDVTAQVEQALLQAGIILK